MENLNTCLVCNHNQLTKELTCKDFVATGQHFDLYRCTNCSFLFTNPRPSVAEIGPYYQSDRYVSHAGNKKDFSFMYKVYDLVRDYSINQKLKHIKTYQPNGLLMDLGCGLGYFLDGVVRDNTFKAIGVDVSEEALEYVKTKFGFNVKNENELDKLEANSYDVITQWHVLEHVHLLNERMKQLKRLLKQTGTMFIAVPNSDSWDAKHYKEFWDGYDVPRHLYHFNQKSFNLLMQNHGFKVVETKSMPFDAPYISMRSEVHMGNKLEFIRGAISGLKSTISAAKNNDHSSLLFVVKHA
ncbi:MAG: class I SAM-dependent methyltransferase [Bacteroidia bacterium]|nr:class I SAM-dependent methyltransferase [Bacteroidia bacterium]MBP9689104.1 class I SAM-dependent methyltransferase [Bacteroidia bacterium]